MNMGTAAAWDGLGIQLDGPRTSSGAAYDGSAESIGDARRFARDFLARVAETPGLAVAPRVAGTVQLVVSELVTNACKYAPGPCLLDLEVTSSTVTIAVWDTSPTLPAVLPPDPSRVGQHGLEIVMALSEGVEFQRETVGKRITIQLAR
ncbi:ATP-binding protein [Streptomyces sp. NPDC060194]|uniref:ATP-binding protein n=1 Tax=Streptomyces sp. NPDC060194 TaxID=3347069 RepID=UPI0036499BAF